MPYEYRLRVCHSVSSCGTAASGSASCQSSGSSHWSLGRFTQPPVVQDNIISLLYTNAGSSDKKCHSQFDRRSSITFRCDANAINDGKGKPKYVGETADCIYQFEWATKYACPASEIEAIECVVRDPKTGHEFDLSVLTREADEPNWIARDSLADDQADHYEFLLNVCGPLTNVDVAKNLGECIGSAACQTKPSDAGFANYALGHAKAEPRLLDSGDLVIEYELPDNWGTKCHGQYVRKAVITFECKPGTLGEPIYVGETDDCQYQFTWETSAACNIRTQVKGSMCKVRDPVTGMQYDLTPLANMDHTIRDQGNTYTLAACGPIKASCKDDFLNAGACQSGSNYGAMPLGKANSDLFLFDGELSLEYTDGSMCHVGTERESDRSLFITFECDHDAGVGKPLFDYESGDCTYFVRWPTAYACSVKPEVECLVVDPKGVEYDLSMLTLTEGNWDVVSAGQSEFQYVINVCHSLNPSTSTRNCSLNAAACQLKHGDANFHKDLGHVLSVPRYDTAAKEIVLEYVSGDVDGCPSARTTTIHFVCNDDPKTDFPLGHPVFRNERETCKYDITWKTIAACPVKDTADLGCRITDPETKQTFDLSDLEPAEVVTIADAATYRISPCSSLGKACGSDARSDACLYQQNAKTFSMGQSQGLQLVGNSLFMRFVHGDKCAGDKYQGSATVKFECGVAAGQALRLATKGVDCSYMFIYRTPLACPFKQTLECIVYDDKSKYTYDLTSLSVKDGSRSVKTSSGATLDLNVCAPVKKTSCPDNSGACLTTTTASSSSSGSTSVSAGSFQNSLPTMTNDYSKVELKYEDGAPCPSGQGTITTVISFRCDKTSAQGPVFKSFQELTASCVFHIDWATCAVCQGINPCGIIEPTTAHPGATTKKPNSNGNNGDNDGSSNSGKNGKGSGNSPGVIVSLVAILTLVVVGIAYFVVKPDTRVRIWRMLFARSTYKPTYKYQKLDSGRGGGVAGFEKEGLIKGGSGGGGGGGDGDGDSSSLSSDDSEELLPVSRA